MLNTLLLVFLSSMVARVGWGLAETLYSHVAYFIWEKFGISL